MNVRRVLSILETVIPSQRAHVYIVYHQLVDTQDMTIRTPKENRLVWKLKINRCLEAKCKDSSLKCRWLHNIVRDGFKKQPPVDRRLGFEAAPNSYICLFVFVFVFVFLFILKAWIFN